jgi:hypothetical protein
MKKWTTIATYSNQNDYQNRYQITDREEEELPADQGND